MTSTKELQKELAKRQGGKSKEHMGDIRELVSLLSDIMFEDSTVGALLINNGARRAKRKK